MRMLLRENKSVTLAWWTKIT